MRTTLVALQLTCRSPFIKSGDTLRDGPFSDAIFASGSPLRNVLMLCSGLGQWGDVWRRSSYLQLPSGAFYGASSQTSRSPCACLPPTDKAPQLHVASSESNSSLIGGSQR